MKKSELFVRNLTADEIEVKAASIGPEGIQFVIHKNARVDMAILDEIAGPLGWKREHKIVSVSGADRYSCVVSIYNEELGEWIQKEDYGDVSSYNTEQIKTFSSDAFKRACTNWGIGRELYSVPEELYGSAKDENGNVLINIRTDQFGRLYTDDVFRVTDVVYRKDDIGDELKAIDKIAIKDDTTGHLVCVFSQVEKRQQIEAMRKFKTAKVTEGNKTAAPTVSFTGGENRNYDSLKPDCGNQTTREKTISQLTTEELVFVFRQTNDAKIKVAISEFAKANQKVAKALKANGIKP